jgi:hypothetical protein
MGGIKIFINKLKLNIKRRLKRSMGIILRKSITIESIAIAIK